MHFQVDKQRPLLESAYFHSPLSLSVIVPDLIGAHVDGSSELAILPALGLGL